MSKFDGHCMCGNISYVVDEGTEPLATVVCHCSICQRQSGAPFSLNVVVADAAFHVSGDTLGEFETTSEETQTPVQRQYCTNCGSPIVSLPAATPDLAFIKAGTLDDRSWLEPEMEIWCRSAHPYVTIDDEARGAFPRSVPLD